MGKDESSWKNPGDFKELKNIKGKYTIRGKKVFCNFRNISFQNHATFILYYSSVTAFFDLATASLQTIETFTYLWFLSIFFFCLMTSINVWKTTSYINICAELLFKNFKMIRSEMFIESAKRFFNGILSLENHFRNMKRKIFGKFANMLVIGTLSFLFPHHILAKSNSVGKKILSKFVTG